MVLIVMMVTVVLSLLVLSGNRACGRGGGSLRAPAVDHHLCSRSRNCAPGNNHSHSVEGEAGCRQLHISDVTNFVPKHMYLTALHILFAYCEMFNCNIWGEEIVLVCHTETNAP